MYINEKRDVLILKTSPSTKSNTKSKRNFTFTQKPLKGVLAVVFGGTKVDVINLHTCTSNVTFLSPFLVITGSDTIVNTLEER